MGKQDNEADTDMLINLQFKCINKSANILVGYLFIQDHSGKVRDWAGL